MNRKDAQKILAHLEAKTKAPGHVIYPARLAQELNLTPKRVEKVLEAWRDNYIYQTGWVTKTWRFIDNNDEDFVLDEDEALAMLEGHFPLQHPETREIAHGQDPKRYIVSNYLTTEKFFKERVQVRIDAEKQKRANTLVKNWLKKTFSADEIDELYNDESYYLLEQMIASEL